MVSKDSEISEDWPSLAIEVSRIPLRGESETSVCARMY